MDTATTAIILAVNIIALLVAFGTIGRWVKGWLVKVVSKPLTTLSDQIGEVQTEVQATRRDVEEVRRDTERAHVRIDQFLLGRPPDA